MRIAVCRPQLLFVRGGVEIFTDRLVAELQARGHDAELIAIPWHTWPNERLLADSLMWRMLDLRMDSALPLDMVITTKFPSYLIRHPNKVVWLVHQFRQAYELHGTELGQFSESAGDQAIRRKIQVMDRLSLSEARRLFATSGNVAQRLLDSTGLEAEVLPHPPQELEFRCESYEPFVLAVGRLDRAKRVDLLIEAAALVPGLEVVVVGEGPDRERLEALSAGLAVTDRVRFAGRAPESELADLYARCRAVFYAPVDEDFGMVPYEAFRSRKPVVTTSDAGGPLEVVHDRKTGLVVAPDPAAIGAALGELLEREPEARAFGEAGHSIAEHVTWDNAIARLLGSTGTTAPG